ncbi:hypothetical protein SAMN06298216_4005 [Spirosomataceae bacterium TFI 002]|nr:hypothetical protein SAMN06298216_4005 [Spirosomataceae bacterium TFI 002]
MKVLNLIVITLFAFAAQGQQIFSSLELENEEPKTAFYLFVKGDIKDISNDIDKYLSEMGKLRERNDIKYVDLKNGLGNSELVYTVAVDLEENKEYNRLIFFFLNRNSESLGLGEVAPDEREEFIYGLYDLVRKNEEERLVKADLELAESNTNLALKEKEKIEKSIERNLRDQEKLGKRLDASPEELTKLINEKNTVLQEKLTGTNKAEEEVDIEKLDKELSKAEKEIVKRKKKEKKDSSKLNQREKQLEDLSQELYDAQNYLRKMEEILRDKKRLTSEVLK